MNILYFDGVPLRESGATCASSQSGVMLKLVNGKNNLVDQLEYNVPIYQDKDGDWMLLGDVPWK